MSVPTALCEGLLTRGINEGQLLDWPREQPVLVAQGRHSSTGESQKRAKICAGGYPSLSQQSSAGRTNCARDILSIARSTSSRRSSCRSFFRIYASDPSDMHNVHHVHVVLLCRKTPDVFLTRAVKGYPDRSSFLFRILRRSRAHLAFPSKRAQIRIDKILTAVVLYEHVNLIALIHSQMDSQPAICPRALNKSE